MSVAGKSTSGKGVKRGDNILTSLTKPEGRPTASYTASIQRTGRNMVIVEQDSNPLGSSHTARHRPRSSVEELLHKYDATGIRNSTPTSAVQVGYRTHQKLRDLKVPRSLTS